MNHNLKNLIRIMVSIVIVTMMIMSCTKIDKKCMPLTSSSRKAVAIAWEAQSINADGFVKEAVELFRQALELDSTFVAANLWYGQNAGLSNAERHKYFMRAQRHMADVPEAEQHMVKSYLALENNDREGVINEIKAIINLYPEDKYMLRLLAVRYVLYGQFENALEYAQKSFQADTNFATIVYYQGYILTQMGKKEEAEKMYKKSIAMKPGIPLYYNNYGQLLRSMGKTDEAAELHKKAIEISPDYLGNLYLGHCYLVTGDYENARNAYNKAFELSLNNTAKNNSLYSIIFSYLYAGDKEGACTAFDRKAEFNRQTTNLNSEVIYSVVYKGFTCFMYDDPDNAWKYINEATGLISTLTLTDMERSNFERYAIFWRVWFQALSGKTIDAQKSLDEFETSIKDAADPAIFTGNLDGLNGIIAFSKKNWTEAIPYLIKANTSFTNYYLGLAYRNAGDIEKAKEIFTKITDTKLTGLQLAIVTPFAKRQLDELAK